MMPVEKDRYGDYKYPSGTLFATCFTSDFLLEEADVWRGYAWEIIRERSDCYFFIITKRIDRFSICLPEDWGDGYNNVIIASTCENQDRADYRLPILLDAPIKHRAIICAPLLEDVDLSPYLGDKILKVSVGGESGNLGRICDYDWVLHIRNQCIQAGVPFEFRQTGTVLRKDGLLQRISKRDQKPMASQMGIDYKPS